MYKNSSCSNFFVMISTTSFFHCFFLSLLCVHGHETFVHETPLGKIKGNKIKLNDQTLYEFIGIRYAQPPLGDLRFKPAQPIDTYNAPFEDGIYDATSFKVSLFNLKQNPIFHNFFHVFLCN